MRRHAAITLLALATPAWAQQPAPPSGLAQVRVTARITVVDTDAITRAGLRYVVLGGDRVRVEGGSGVDARQRGAGVEVATHGVRAFLDVARENRWIRSESTQQVLTLSGGEGIIASTRMAVGGRAARTRGPSLAVSPRVLADGRIRLHVRARLEDEVRYAWGYGVDGSPAAVETEVVARDGVEMLLASSSGVEASHEAGLLGWATAEQGRDVLVSVTAEVVTP